MKVLAKGGVAIASVKFGGNKKNKGSVKQIIKKKKELVKNKKNGRKVI